MALFAAAIFVSAFLLFLVQPLIGKFILPWFGGATGVWTTCMLFFQLVLVAGYGYAHLLARVKVLKVQMVVHLLFLGASLAFLPIIPNEAVWKPVTAEDPTWRILALLGVTLGFPYMALSSTGPLLQNWFGRRYPGIPPYRLYALSNLGSLLALVAYPFLIEPELSRMNQASWWSWGFFGFAVLGAGCTVLAGQTKGEAQRTALPPSPAPAIIQRAMWLLFPAAASVMLLAVTNRICQDIAVIPFLWVLPLSLYLLTFIIAFDKAKWYHRGVFIPLLVLAMLLLLIVQTSGLLAQSLPILLQIGVYAGLMFVVCMICHGEVYRLRPATDRLTGYYLSISIGGALGGMFVALAAPIIFDRFVEMFVGIFATVGLLAVQLHRDPKSVFFDGDRRPGLIGMLLVFVVLGSYLLQTTLSDTAPVLERSRNFYGTLAIYEKKSPTGNSGLRFMVHGLISHGVQYSREPRTPTSYFTEIAGVGRLLRNTEGKGGRKLGLIGLGVGTLAAYGQRGDDVVFYEINPEVDRLARKYFTFLSDLEAVTKLEMVLGDARLKLEQEQPRGYDVLVIDAFSSDAIPVHLLTSEAMDIYRKHLAPRGVIALHITNAYLNLEPVVARLARYAGMNARLFHSPEDRAIIANEATWVILAPDEAFFEQHKLLEHSRPLADPPDSVRLWTDDDSNLFRILGSSQGRSRGGAGN